MSGTTVSLLQSFPPQRVPEAEGESQRATELLPRIWASRAKVQELWPLPPPGQSAAGLWPEDGNSALRDIMAH